MAKYTKEVKAQAVEMAKEGKSLKEIQSTLGPNPKAVMRYLKAVGIDYKVLKEELKEKGILKPAIRKNKKGREADEKKAKAKASKQKEVQATEVIEE